MRARRGDVTRLHQVLDELLWGAAAGRVGDRPGRNLLNVDLGVAQDVDERRDDSRLDHLLDLVLVAGDDAALLAQAKFENCVGVSNT